MGEHWNHLWKIFLGEISTKSVITYKLPVFVVTPSGWFILEKGIGFVAKAFTLKKIYSYLPH